MAEEKITRKLTTILAADVEGYTRLMRADEEATLKTLSDYREIFDGLIARHDGRVFSTGGDSVLAEFGSAVEAVRCAISFQEEIATRNAELMDDRKVMFRIGINVGDVMIRDGDLFGDGVNVAARLEGLAEPGGVCISGSVFEQIKHKMSLGFEDMGQQEVKNIAEPISAYRLVPGPVSVSAVATAVAMPSGARRWWMSTIAAVVVVIIAAGGLAVWHFYLRGPAPITEVASVERMAFPLPDKPSIAVLPFANMSDDPKQGFFADGMSESIITTLSKIPNMFVIARNSTFTYKGKPIKVQQVAEELGVQYVLEGSVQRQHERVRITAQLVDALSGRHLWAERYDREVKDIFALQDEITREVVTALQVELTEGDQARVWRGQTDNTEAYEYYFRGLEQWRRLAKPGNDQARQLFEKAVALDPGFAAAWVELARTHYLAARFGWSKEPTRSTARAAELAQKALAIDDTQADTYAMLSNVAVLKRQHDQAMAYCEEALALNPNAEATAHCARNVSYIGRPDEALELIKRAMRLSPYYPGWYLCIVGVAHRRMGDYDKAIAAFEGCRDRIPGSPVIHAALAAAYSLAGRDDEARAAVAEALKRNSRYSIKQFAKAMLYKDASETERLVNALRKAGLPE